MKRNPEFLLRDVADTLVLVPVGKAAADFAGMITLNATGAVLWECLETEQTLESLVQALTDRYEVGAEQATEDVKAVLDALASAGAVLK